MVKKNGNVPRRKRYSQTQQLSCAPAWLKAEGLSQKNQEYAKLIKRSAQWYGVSRLCALAELERLGYSFPEGTKAREQAMEQNKVLDRQKRKQKRLENETYIEDLDFVVGDFEEWDGWADLNFSEPEEIDFFEVEKWEAFNKEM